MTDEKEKEVAAGDMVTAYRVIQAAAGSASAIPNHLMQPIRLRSRIEPAALVEPTGGARLRPCLS